MQMNALHLNTVFRLYKNLMMYSKENNDEVCGYIIKFNNAGEYIIFHFFFFDEKINNDFLRNISVTFYNNLIMI